MNKLDKDRNVTQEYLDYVKNLDREDLERFYMGADLIIERIKAIIYNEKISNIETRLMIKDVLEGK